MTPGAEQPPTVRASAEARASSLSRTPDDPRVIAAMEEYLGEIQRKVLECMAARLLWQRGTRMLRPVVSRAGVLMLDSRT
jgi:hypothetical protein